jgi:CubicO group peptidase (beta-lactamase class C family)
VIVLTFALTASLAAQTPSCTAAVRSDGTPLDSAVVAAMHEHNVPGAAIVIVRGGAVDMLRGYGCADLERDVPVDPRTTVFRVASVSKSFVATATLVAAERGLVDLRTDVNRYLRGLQVPTAWNRPITLHDLLTHTAGLEESVIGYAARTPADIRPLGEFLAAKLPRRGWPPGDVTSYSNYGYALAGYVVESAAGTSFANYVQREVLSPLGMTRSSFAQPLPPALERNLATSYRCTADGCTRVERDYRSAYPPGGLATTPDDMSRFLLAQLGIPVDGRRVLTDSVLGLMRTRQFSHHPRLPGLTYGFVEEGVGDERALTHAGGASGFTSFVVIVPAVSSPRSWWRTEARLDSVQRPAMR